MAKPAHAVPGCPYKEHPGDTTSRKCDFMYLHRGPHSFDIGSVNSNAVTPRLSYAELEHRYNELLAESRRGGRDVLDMD